MRTQMSLQSFADAFAWRVRCARELSQETKGSREEDRRRDRKCETDSDYIGSGNLKEVRIPQDVTETKIIRLHWQSSYGMK